MSAIIPYLNFDGDCEAAFLFYQSVLGGEIPYLGRFGDMPPSEQGKVANDDANKIMHMSLVSDDGMTILGSDCPSDYLAHFSKGNNVSLSINAESRDEAKRIFDGLSAGGHINMPLEDTFWGAYFGMWTDKFGINWMVNYDDPAKMQQHP
ncbi:VOC family protein [Flavobacterium silvaticum]|uniref:VOC family protein n=1 Tax=Flavobacterium silvaticum TaxID=1852020 RepID=A0A972FLG7_9FLAO|nr:VOC family protein [Flavobacterium silvaticum]NMH27903.1 VOC family protein [Flavobacterium silvaticum]